MAKILKRTRNILVGVILLFIWPFIMLALLPFVCYREFVKCLAKVFKRDLVKMVPLEGSAFFALDNQRHKKSYATILVTTILDGKSLTTKNICEIISQNIISQPNYPELTCILTTWLGYYFWKKSDNFNIENHVKQHNCNKEILNQDDLTELEEHFVSKGHNPEQCPWEIILINDFKMLETDSGLLEDRALIMWRFHHGLADGYTILNVTEQANSTVKPFSRVPLNFPKFGFCGKILFGVLLPFRTAYDFANFMTSKWSMSNAFTDYRPQRSKLLHKNKLFRLNYPVYRLKAIKNACKVSFQSVLFTTYVQAVNYAIDNIYNEKLPEYVLIASASARPKHPEKLRNHARPVSIKLHTAKDFSSAHLLQETQQEMDRMSKSALIVTAVSLVKPIANLFPLLIKTIARKANPPDLSVFASFPGPTETVNVFDLKVDRVLVCVGSLKGPLGFYCEAVTYDQSLEIALHVDEGLPSYKQFGDALTSSFKQQLDLLYKCSTCDEISCEDDLV